MLFAMEVRLYNLPLAARVPASPNHDPNRHVLSGYCLVGRPTTQALLSASKERRASLS